MKVLIFGADGFIGHQLFKTLSADFEVTASLRQAQANYQGLNLFTPTNSLFEIDMLESGSAERALTTSQPDVVINAVGVVKQRQDKRAQETMRALNAEWPHQLFALTEAMGARLIHISSDCVFSGSKGQYTEADTPDATDLYGQTKAVGELNNNSALTLRTSTIGLELPHRTPHGLIEWFLASQGDILGYRRACYSGLTTPEFARVVGQVIRQHPQLSGLYQVAAQPIDKYTLLTKLAQRLGREDVAITADDTFVCDRSLDASAFTEATGYQVPDWDAMLAELAQEIKRERL